MRMDLVRYQDRGGLVLRQLIFGIIVLMAIGGGRECSNT